MKTNKEIKANPTNTERLLVALNEGEITWSDVDGATLHLLDETIEGQKYIVDLGVEIEEKTYLWRIMGEIKNV